MSVLTQKEREFVDSIRINLVCYSIAEGQRLVSFIDRLDARCEEMEGICEEFIENTVLPDADCSCHLSSPCNDCVEYSFTRELIVRAKAAVQKKEPE